MYWTMLGHQSSRCGLKQFSITERLARVKFAFKGRSELKITHVVGFHTQVRKTNSDRVYILYETVRKGLQHF